MFLKCYSHIPTPNSHRANKTEVFSTYIAFPSCERIRRRIRRSRPRVGSWPESFDSRRKDPEFSTSTHSIPLFFSVETREIFMLLYLTVTKLYDNRLNYRKKS